MRGKAGVDLGFSRVGKRIFKKIENFVDLFLGRPNWISVLVLRQFFENFD